jgi:hypothetical protein
MARPLSGPRRRILVVLTAVPVLAGGCALFRDDPDIGECQEERLELAHAVEDFQANEGRNPASEAELVAADYLDEESYYYDYTISETGHVSSDAAQGAPLCNPD